MFIYEACYFSYNNGNGDYNGGDNPGDGGDTVSSDNNSDLRSLANPIKKKEETFVAEEINIESVKVEVPNLFNMELKNCKVGRISGIKRFSPY